MRNQEYRKRYGCLFRELFGLFTGVLMLASTGCNNLMGNLLVDLRQPSSITEPSPAPSALVPSPSPTVRPSPSPTVRPSPSPTVRPSPSPTVRPSPSPTVRPSPSPSPSAIPTLIPGDRIALVQYNADAHYGDYNYNLQELTRFAQEAVSNGANLILFPEGSLYGYASASRTWCLPGTTGCANRSCDSVAQIAEAVPGGRSTIYWAQFAHQNNVSVIFNVPEAESGSYYNTLVVVGPEGYVAKYRKRALYYIDKCYAKAGTTPTVINTTSGKLGLMICLDGVDSSGTLYRQNQNLGAQAILISMDWDESATGTNPASRFFRTKAGAVGMDIYASDVSTWDGTAFYPSSGAARIRNGMPASAIGQNGISYHDIP